MRQNEWQPMETAPKDKRILVYSPKYKEQFVVFFAQSLERQIEGPDTAWVIARGKDLTFIVPDPSHWRDLPDDPKEQSNAD